jgi:Icc-related predicted phosphoesterase
LEGFRVTLPDVRNLALASTVLFVPSAIGLAVACGEDAPAQKPASNLSFPYTPEGCGYSVSPPSDIEEASGDGSAVGADPDPKHVHVTWAGAPESTFAVTWATGLDTRLTQLLYGSDKAAVEAADGPTDGVTRAKGHTMQLGSPLFADQKTRLHEVHVCGLGSDSVYYYKVGGPGHWSTVYDVATAPVPGDQAPFRFAVSGDSRGSGDVFAQIAQAVSGQGIDFQIFTGDLIDNTTNQNDWDKLFEGKVGSFATQDLIATRPLMPVNGNHDNLGVYYLGNFALPQVVSNGESAEGEEWYSFDYANAHFVMLSSEGGAQLDAQAAFMDEDLAKVDRTKTPWVFVVFHRAPYTCGSKHQSDSVAPRTKWQPLFDKYSVDVVFTGHVHNYQRSKPIRGFAAGTTDGIVAAAGPNGEPVAESGTVYVVSGGATPDLYGTDPASSCAFSQFTEETHHYVIVEVANRTLSYKAIRLDGSEMDAFTYTK